MNGMGIIIRGGGRELGRKRREREKESRRSAIVCLDKKGRAGKGEGGGKKS